MGRDKYEPIDGLVATVVCAKCKRAVRQGEEHICPSIQSQTDKFNEENKNDPFDFDVDSTPFPMPSKYIQ